MSIFWTWILALAVPGACAGVETLGDWELRAPKGFAAESVDECFSEGASAGKGKCLGWIPKDILRRRAQSQLKEKGALKPMKALSVVLGQRLVGRPDVDYYVTAARKFPNKTYDCMTGCSLDGEMSGSVVESTLKGHAVYLFTCVRAGYKDRFYRDHILVCPLGDRGGIDLVYGYPSPTARDRWLTSFHQAAASLDPRETEAERWLMSLVEKSTPGAAVPLPQDTGEAQTPVLR